ncbi:hypothetical protein [Bacillus sp. V5-8f]|uniref:hypothetical protein n=1 Tax=Bacillus sp. V5-8f TaxID=2053044 RepID=UPI000C7662EB|nr:hypothetical protein [Bacillus sp. V5-8f]PLT32524.1 hypothetical protein CUU64_18640 [Bacillus sp. V5-8f]
MKKVLLAILLLFSLVTPLQEHSEASAASSVQTMVNKQLAAVKQRKIPGYVFHQADFVYFTGKSVPEIVVSSYGYEKGTTLIDKSLLQVYQYNPSTKKWSIINSFASSYQIYNYRPLSIITKGKLIDNKKEQMVVGYVWGSRFDLTPIVYGSTDGKKIKPLITTGENSFQDGNAIIKNKQLYFVSSLAFVKDKYVYKSGKFVRSQGTGADDLAIASGAKHSITVEKIKGKSVISAKSSITMKVGDTLSIVRKNKTDKSFYDLRFWNSFWKQGPLKNQSGVLKAVSPGKVTIDMQLDYNFNKTVYVNVVK